MTLKAVWLPVSELEKLSFNSEVNYVCSRCGGYVLKVQDTCPFCNSEMVATKEKMRGNITYVKD